MSKAMKFDLQNKSAHISSLNKTPASIVQEYAAKKQLTPQYNLIHNGISQSKVSFKYSLRLNGYETVGEGSSKKEAKHVAALNLLKIMITDNPQLLETDFKEWDFENHVVSPYENTIKENAVGILNDICTNNKLYMPVFNLVREEGQAHAKLFTVSCRVNNMIETATHKTKKQAKHISANNMIEKIKSITKTLVPVKNENNVSTCLKVIEQVQLIKSDAQKNTPIDVQVSNYHLLFKNTEWPDPDVITKFMEQFKSLDDIVKINDSMDFLKKFVEETGLLLSEKSFSKNVVISNNNQSYIISIDNVYPPIYGIGIDNNSDMAKEKAATMLLKNIYILLK